MLIFQHFGSPPGSELAFTMDLSRKYEGVKKVNQSNDQMLDEPIRRYVNDVRDQLSRDHKYQLDDSVLHEFQVFLELAFEIATKRSDPPECTTI